MTTENKEKLLEQLRLDVDRIDKELVRLLNNRSEKSLLIGTLKTELGMDLISTEREKAIFNNILNLRQEFISPEALERIYKVIIEESRSIQNKTKGYKGESD